ncbi:heat-inducible transcriptional repressor HrcA [Rhodovibrionaceae bacterium A322]
MADLHSLQLGKLAEIEALDQRSRDILRLVVDSYVQTGAPVGSRTLARAMGMSLSPATVRNVMADLEHLGLLVAPHTSAGRLPTDQGLRLYVDGLLEQGNLSQDEREKIAGQCAGAGHSSTTEVMEEASSLLSALSNCAGLVLAPKREEPLEHIEFVSLGPGRVLVILVMASGSVENRVIDVPMGLPASSLIEASNYLTHHLRGRSLSDAQKVVRQELDQQKAQLDALTKPLIEAGLANWTGNSPVGGGDLIVRGQAQLLQDVQVIEDLERVRHLFTALEKKEALLKMLDLTESSEGVQIFIGGENELFSLAGCSMVIAPYANSQQQIVGAVGVIGPTRLDYARIIPMVDYTAKVVSDLLR